MLAPALVFLGARSALHATVQRSGIYVDPVAEPLEFMFAIVTRVPVLLSDFVFALRADYWTAGSPWMQLWFQKHWIPRRWVHDPEPWRFIHFGIGIVACGLMLALYRATLGRHRHRNVRWLVLGGLISLVPVCASFPSSRLVLVALIGFEPLLAVFIVESAAQLAQLRSGSIRALSMAVLGALLFLYQVVIPVGLQRVEIAGVPEAVARVREAMLRMDVDERAFPTQDLILLTALEGGTSMYLPATRLRYGHPAPRSCKLLSYVPAPYTLVRLARNAFTIRYDGGYALLRTSNERLFRSQRLPLRQFDTVDVGTFRATIIDMYEGLPRSVLFEFDRPLEDPSLLFMIPVPQGYRRFEMPAIGQPAAVPPPGIPQLKVSLARAQRFGT
jgi:hypothetical protein